MSGVRSIAIATIHNFANLLHLKYAGCQGVFIDWYTPPPAPIIFVHGSYM